jgi:hydroxypyruvate reductase
VDRAWPEVAVSGVVVTRYGHAAPAGRVRVLEAGHPVPDENSLAAGRAMLAAVDGLGPDDLVLALISGGGSALMVAPVAGLTLAEKGRVTRALLQSGASISEMNAVRRRLSVIKGGGLAAAAGDARVVTLAISDVPGDDPAVIASGPTWTQAVPGEAAEAILARYGIAMPDGIVPAAERVPRTGDRFSLIATPALSLAAAARVAREAGVTPVILGDALEGESREVGRVMAGMALSCRAHGQPGTAPVVLLSGGETSVTITGGMAGRGGRNTEFLLGFAAQLAGAGAGIWALAGDTDGIDGTEDAAGAFVTPDTLARAREAGLDARGMLRAHDSYSLFSALGDLVVTGPTLTNVNDFRAILIA